jgi:hypothetical protein
MLAMVMAMFGQAPIAEQRAGQHRSLFLREHCRSIQNFPRRYPHTSTVPLGTVGQVGLSPIQPVLTMALPPKRTRYHNCYFRSKELELLTDSSSQSRCDKSAGRRFRRPLVVTDEVGLCHHPRLARGAGV